MPRWATIAAVVHPERKRILLVSESITLAQVVRLVVLGGALDPQRFEVHFASGRFPELVFGGTGFVRHAIETLPENKVLPVLQKGRRIYGVRSLKRYVAAERVLFDTVRPDLVVGDFRLSLTVSAAAAGIPLAVLINAYWSPFRADSRWPVQDHPIVRILGEELAERFFPWARPWAFKHFAAPVNRLRRCHGLAPIGSLERVLTCGDWTLYPDDPEMFSLENAPASHRFLGPVQWAPEIPLPEGLDADDSRPLIYVTLGSSGRLDWMGLVAEALGPLPVRVVLASAGRSARAPLPANFEVHDFVPGDQIARRAALVICNGGSTTGYQALAAGTPVLGLPSNLDQYLAMEAIERTGAGILVKARSADPPALKVAVEKMLGTPEYRQRAAAIARRFERLDAGAAFRRWVAEVLGG